MKKKNNIIGRLYLIMFLSLIPELLFGLYKNGYQLYKKDLITFVEMIKPLILVLMSVAGGFIGSYIRERKNKVKDIVEILNNNKIILLESTILSFIMPINGSPIIIFAATVVMGLFFRKVSINRIALFYLGINMFNKVAGLNSFLNLYEYTTTLNYSTLDLFIGFSNGGICSTSILFISIALLVFSLNKLYKKDLAYSSIITYTILIIVYGIITKNYTGILPILFGYNTMFIFVYVAPNLYSTSYTERGQILSGLLLGIITFSLRFAIPYTAPMIGVLLISVSRKILDKRFSLKKM